MPKLVNHTKIQFQNFQLFHRRFMGVKSRVLVPLHRHVKNDWNRARVIKINLSMIMMMVESWTMIKISSWFIFTFVILPDYEPMPEQRARAWGISRLEDKPHHFRRFLPRCLSRSPSAIPRLTTATATGRNYCISRKISQFLPALRVKNKFT